MGKKARVWFATRVPERFADLEAARIREPLLDSRSEHTMEQASARRGLISDPGSETRRHWLGTRKWGENPGY